MEERETPEAGEPPLADICGVQFGMMTTSAILKLSVFDHQPDSQSLKSKELTSARLGLPTASGQCTTCTASSVDKCQGHFGHILLPTPIFHPNHVGRLIRLLRKICLNCGKPKKKKSRRSRLVNTTEQNGNKGNSAGNSKMSNTSSQVTVDTDETSKNKRKFSTFLDEDLLSQEAEASEVIVLSSDEEERLNRAKKQQETPDCFLEDNSFRGKASSSSARRSWNGKRKRPVDAPETSSAIAPTVVDLTDMLVCVRKPKRAKGPKSRSGVEVVDDTFCSSPRDDSFSEQICFYCSAHSQSDRYPEVQLKVEVKDGGRGDTVTLAKSIRMEIRNNDYKNVAPEYWGFVGGNSSSSNQRVPLTRNLLPSEALKIIRKIPHDSLLVLGIQPDLAPPEALIVECLPVPPNCTRLQEDALGAGGTNIGFSIGFDRATQAFTKLLNKINSIRASRYGRPSFHAAFQEASSLQALFGQYLREKGAPKQAAPGKEKKRTDHIGRVQRRDGRWSLDWLKRNVLGKRSGFSARNVLTGDPFLTVEEIGVPLEVAKYLTYPVRVTRLNQSKLQECVEIGQGLGMTIACGAVRIVKNGEKLEVTAKSAHQLEIGDVVHRHLRDGDLVYVNRPPSLHKHSLIALKTHLQDSATFKINPAVCPPLHADFDGDCLHVFVPQSEESKAELHQLLSIPEQILPSPEGKTIIGLSQDHILATQLVTSSPLFVDKELMHQLAMWSSWKLPIPTIVKAPKVGPLWTGKQVLDLTIPDEFKYQNDEGTIIIQDGELLSYGGQANWLASTSGLVSTVARHDPKTAVKHLDSSQAVLREWLLSHGFSVSLKDFYAAPDRAVRRMIKAQILDGLEKGQCMATDKQHIFDRKLQKLEALHPDMNGILRALGSCRGSSSGVVSEDIDEDRPLDATTRGSRYHTNDALEDVAVTHFLGTFSEIGEQIGEAVGCENSLLAMVRSGSKGSTAKAFQQIGCLGLQLYKGEKLFAIQENNKLRAVARATGHLDKWEARGLVRSSLLDGLEPLEFFFHAIAVRAGLLRQSLEVTEPGELFKRLMLFLRDVHVSYDGSVRKKCGLEIIQFSYAGGKPLESNECVPVEWNGVTPGEAVGILAATAIAQPAYQVMLEANHNVGSKKIRPLELLQETMFPRSTSSLKASDRRSILRLSDCDCGKLYCDERRILQIQSELQPATMQNMAISTAIEYIPDVSDEWDAFCVNGERQKPRMPWVGHILLDQIAMIESGLDKEKLLQVLKTKFETCTKALLKFQLGLPLFCFRDECSCIGDSFEDRQNGPCLHFSPMPASNVKRRKVKVLKDATLEILDLLQNFLMPLIMNTTVKGDDRIESARVVWEDVAWSPPRHSNRENYFSDEASSGELVLEVTVKEKFSNGRGVPWMITKEACLPIEEAIDWKRSSPYSVQEMKYAFGVEAARDCILQRFNLATEASGSSMGIQHLTLVADLMVHSGEVHGLTSHGYRDLLRSLKTTAPFTTGAFRAPIKHFMEAGERGDEEVLSGVLATSVFGKRVPVGTGADFSLKMSTPGITDFSLKMNSPRSSYDSQGISESVDVHQCLMDTIGKIGVERPETPPCSEVEFGDDANDNGLQSSSFKTGVEDADGWDTGGWGDKDKSSFTKRGNSDGWDSPDKDASTKLVSSVEWGSPCKSISAAKEVTVGGWADDERWQGSPDRTGRKNEAGSEPWEDNANTTAGKSSVNVCGSTQDTEVAARRLGDTIKSTSVKDIGCGCGTKHGVTAGTLKSGGWDHTVSDDAGAWAVEDTTQCSNAGGWSWDPSLKGSQLLSSPKVRTTKWMDDADVQGCRSSWDDLPSVPSSGLEERPSKVSRNQNARTELQSSQGRSRNSGVSGQRKTDATFTQCQSGRDWNDSSPAATLDTLSVDRFECSSRSATHSLWPCKENTDCCTVESKGRKEFDVSRKKEGREFRPTGANSIPLGGLRVFKKTVVELPDFDSPSPPYESAVLSEDEGNQHLPDPVIEVDLELGGNVGQEVEGVSLWMNLKDGGNKDGVSGSSPTPDPQTVAADLTGRRVAIGGHKVDQKFICSPNSRMQQDIADPRHRFAGCEPEISGGWLPRRDQNWKRTEADPRRESEDWKELETLVRSVKNIIRKYEPEARLEEEDQNLLLTEVLPNHPGSAVKVGCGIDYIKVANHMHTRCFFLVREDGTTEDFSYHKCLVTLASKKNPPLADLYQSQFMSNWKIEGWVDTAQTTEIPVCTDGRN